jgi:hypothetical protein
VSELFLAIQGRFDAGVLVCDSRRRQRAADAPGTFLGYQVADIDVVRLDRGGYESGRKMQLARSPDRPETRILSPRRRPPSLGLRAGPMARGTQARVQRMIPARRSFARDAETANEP